MIHLFINALAASAGGGLTYVRNVIPYLAARPDAKATVCLDIRLRREFQASPHITFVERENASSAARRFSFEQFVVPRLIRRSGANVLLSAGNFALWNSPVPQILLSRNSLYTSSDFLSDLRFRGEWQLLLDTELKAALAKWSIQRADHAVAPSEAFAEELRLWTVTPVAAIHHGFDRDAFIRDQSPLPETVRNRLDCARDSLRILFVSHYNYYRNFETLLRALPSIKKHLGSRPVRLFLTCKLSAGANPGAYRPDSAAALVHQLGLTKEVVELGMVPYHLLHQVYNSADIYVTPAYAESFAHPLVEAMASGLPIIASDIAVHREICGAAALYFPRFSPEALAEQVLRVGKSGMLRDEMLRQSAARSRIFSWQKHVDQLLSLARGLVDSVRI
jgi:glycosyltransferase involved in cell wall biosynthesis